MRRVLSVAGIEISFHGEAADAVMLDERYGPFLVDSTRPGDARVDLSLRDSAHATGSPFDFVAEQEGDTFTLESRELNARIASNGSAAHVEAPRLERYVDTVVRYVLARQLLDRGALLLHASAVVRDGEAWVFAGPSGVGKTTISENLPGSVLGDEAVALEREGDALLCHATPYWRAAPAIVPVSGVLFPQLGEEKRWTPLTTARGLGKLVSCTGPLLPGSEGHVMVAAERLLSAAGIEVASITMASIRDIQEWLHPQIAGLSAGKPLVE